MPDHHTLLQNLWVVVGIALGGGGFAGRIAAIFGDIGFGLRLVITAGVAVIIFGTIWFFAPAAHA